MSGVRRTMGVMDNTMICERCDGSGADPMQAFFDDDAVVLCIECRGDGIQVWFDGEPAHELRLSA